MSSDRIRGGEPRWNRREFDQEQSRSGNRERHDRGYESGRDTEYREPFERERWGEQGQGRSSYSASRGQGRGDSQADGEPYESGDSREHGSQSYGRYGRSQQYSRYGSREGFGEGRGTWEGDGREARSYGSGRAEYSEGASPSAYGSSGSFEPGRRFSSFRSERSGGPASLGYGEEQRRPSDRFDGHDRAAETGRPYGRPGRAFTRGRFTGKGPKGYQRSDDRVKEDVSEALSRDGDLDASEIEVSVASGEVTLAGTVPDRESKRLAEDLAEEIPGVKQVQNRLRIENGPQGREEESSMSSSGAKGASSSSTAGSRGKSSI